jgi:hypothetical protein
VDIVTDEEVIRKLTEFIDGQIGPTSGFQSVALSLNKQIEKKLTTSHFESSPTFNDSQASRLSMYGAKNRRNISDFDPIEVAKQLTLLEFNNYKAIQELLNQAWNKSDKEINAPNIVNMIKRTNAVPLWVATEIVSCDKQNIRTKLIRSFISIAEVSFNFIIIKKKIKFNVHSISFL